MTTNHTKGRLGRGVHILTSGEHLAEPARVRSRTTCPGGAWFGLSALLHRVLRDTVHMTLEAPREELKAGRRVTFRHRPARCLAERFLWRDIGNDRVSPSHLVVRCTRLAGERKHGLCEIDVGVLHELPELLVVKLWRISPHLPQRPESRSADRKQQVPQNRRAEYLLHCHLLAESPSSAAWRGHA